MPSPGVNALSELEGLRPAYYADSAFTEPFRTVMERRYRAQANQRPVVYFDSSAPGYRLPTGAEFVYLSTHGGELVGWDSKTSGQHTHRSPPCPPTPTVFTTCTVMSPSTSGPAAKVSIPPETPSPTGAWAQATAGGPEKRQRRSCPSVKSPLAAATRWGSASYAAAPVPCLPYPPHSSRLNISPRPEARPSRQIDPKTIASLAAKRLGDHVFPGAGSLPSNDNPNKKYPAKESYDIAVSEVEIPYWLWSIVKQWATQQASYRFNHTGDMGNLKYLAPGTEKAEHERNEPVTNITWYDAIVWCNALSELEGRAPVYRLKDSGKPLRDASTMRLPMYQDYHYMNTDATANAILMTPRS